MQIKALIFDVDGVLLDTVQYHFKAWEKLFHSFGYQFTYNDYLQKVNGLPRIQGIKNIVSKSISEDEINKMCDKKQSYYIKLVNENIPQPLKGVEKVLKYLQKINLIAIAASSSKNAPLLLKKSRLDKYFKKIISGNDFIYPKPDPDIFLTACKSVHVQPYYCIVFEDALTGIEAAQNAEMHTVGITGSGDKTIGKKAELSINSFEEFDTVKKYFKI